LIKGYVEGEDTWNRHHSDTTGNAIRCNTGQAVAEEAA
jgi:hypothetical protein